MKITNISNHRRKVEGVWFEPGETKEVKDISEDSLESRHFRLEDDDTASKEVKTEDETEDDEEESKPEEKNNNEGDE